MSLELACPQCEGRLLADTPGIVVACPHCGQHLMTPDFPSAESSAPLASPVVESPPPSPPPQEAVPDSSGVHTAPSEPPPAVQDAFPDFSAVEEVPAEPEAENKFPDFNDIGRDEEGFRFPSFDSPDEVSWGRGGGTAVARAQPSSVIKANRIEATPVPAEAVPSQAAPSASAAPAAPAPVGSGRHRNASGRGGTVPALWFMLAVSYAAAMTIMFVFQLISSSGAKSHDLESLPDIKPPMKNGEVQPQLVPADAPMPNGHTLRLNESQRFGSLAVTPLRVERAPLEFAHFNDPGLTKTGSAPVLKLWLRFENVSTDQVFTPLCRELAFNRYFGRNADREQANNFVCRQEDKSSGEVVLHYNLVLSDVWDPKGQNLGRVLQPGESFETYIPTTEEGLDRLSGDLIWRVHFRKGYNPQSHRGVTTLIEVDFHSNQIQRG